MFLTQILPNTINIPLIKEITPPAPIDQGKSGKKTHTLRKQSSIIIIFTLPTKLMKLLIHTLPSNLATRIPPHISIRDMLRITTIHKSLCWHQPYVNKSHYMNKTNTSPLSQIPKITILVKPKKIIFSIK